MKTKVFTLCLAVFSLLCISSCLVQEDGVDPDDTITPLIVDEDSILSYIENLYRTDLNDATIDAPLQFIQKNSVLVLTVDYTTNRFLGGYSLPLASNGEDFELSYAYLPSGDFGGIACYEKSAHQILFSGTIIWMGKGKRYYPETLHSPNSFARQNNLIPLPQVKQTGDLPNLEHDYLRIWESVANLEIAEQYLSSNPSVPINIIIYQPSVGKGDPADWYWLIFLQN